MSKICIYCGGTGYDIKTQEPCDCNTSKPIYTQNYTGVTWIPKQYKDIYLDKNLSPSPITIERLSYYRKRIVKAKTSTKNYIFYGKHKVGKTIFAYRVLQDIYEGGSEIFPILDTKEVEYTMEAIQYGKKQIYLPSEVIPESLYTVPILFIKVYGEKSFSTVNTINSIVDRRTRRNLGTFFLSSYRIEEIAPNSDPSLIRLGNGEYGTIEVIELEPD